ncbi:MAG: TIGR00730 family Rossman fold protein [Microthrixaceae bacterium]|nr:TIGR00730 family Rossman fold protein [Microthrixaceae bacterium]
MEPSRSDSGRPRLAVYCASRRGSDPEFAEVAHRVGAGMAERGIDLVFGGGSIGLMGVVADAAIAGGSHAVGVITEQLLDREVAHHGVDEMRVVADMPARKQQMYALADAFLTLPGGIGTMEEFFEVLTWGYLGLHPKPMGLLNVNGYYDPLLGFLDHAIDKGMLKPTVLNLIAVGRDETILDDLLGAAALRVS